MSETSAIEINPIKETVNNGEINKLLALSEIEKVKLVANCLVEGKFNKNVIVQSINEAKKEKQNGNKTLAFNLLTNANAIIKEEETNNPYFEFYSHDYFRCLKYVAEEMKDCSSKNIQSDLTKQLFDFVEKHNRKKDFDYISSKIHNIIDIASIAHNAGLDYKKYLEKALKIIQISDFNKTFSGLQNISKKLIDSNFSDDDYNQLIIPTILEKITKYEQSLIIDSYDSKARNLLYQTGKELVGSGKIEIGLNLLSKIDHFDLKEKVNVFVETNHTDLALQMAENQENPFLKSEILTEIVSSIKNIDKVNSQKILNLIKNFISNNNMGIEKILLIENSCYLAKLMVDIKQIDNAKELVDLIPEGILFSSSLNATELSEILLKTGNTNKNELLIQTKINESDVYENIHKKAQNWADIAEIYSVLGKKDEADKWIEKIQSNYEQIGNWQFLEISKKMIRADYAEDAIKIIKNKLPYRNSELSELFDLLLDKNKENLAEEVLYFLNNEKGCEYIFYNKIDKLVEKGNKEFVTKLLQHPYLRNYYLGMFSHLYFNEMYEEAKFFNLKEFGSSISDFSKALAGEQEKELEKKYMELIKSFYNKYNNQDINFEILFNEIKNNPEIINEDFIKRLLILKPQTGYIEKVIDILPDHKKIDLNSIVNLNTINPISEALNDLDSYHFINYSNIDFYPYIKDWDMYRKLEQGHVIKREPKIINYEIQLNVMSSLEKENAGICEYLRLNYGITNFARYSRENMIDMFNQKDSKKDFGIFVYAKDDYNGAMTKSVEVINNFYKEIKEHYSVKIIEAPDKLSLFTNIIKTFRKHGEISFVIIFAHGSPTNFSLGPNENGNIGIKDVDSKATQYLKEKVYKPNLPFGFISCSTGRKGGIAQEFSKKFESNTVGPKTTVSIKSISPIFDTNKKIVSFKIIYEGIKPSKRNSDQNFYKGEISQITN